MPTALSAGRREACGKDLIPLSPRRAGCRADRHRSWCTRCAGWSLPSFRSMMWSTISRWPWPLSGVAYCQL